jgi:hypothetical protein
LFSYECTNPQQAASDTRTINKGAIDCSEH